MGVRTAEYAHILPAASAEISSLTYSKSSGAAFSQCPFQFVDHTGFADQQRGVQTNMVVAQAAVAWMTTRAARSSLVLWNEFELGFGCDGFPVVHHTSPQKRGRVERTGDPCRRSDGDRAAIQPGGNRDRIGTDTANV